MKHRTSPLLALLHADAENYTGRMSGDPDGTVRAIKACRLVFGKLITSNNGRIVNRVGDNVLAVFESAKDAVLAASQIQERLVEPLGRLNNLPPIPFRIGIDYGHVYLQGKEIYGDAVNRASRIQEAAEPNGILISESAYSNIEIQEKIDLVDQGFHQLRGLNEKIRLFRVHNKTSPVSVAGRRRVVVSQTIPDLPSIVVLPFRNVNKENTNEHIADGITEELISSLSCFRDLFVIGRASAFIYRGRHIHPIIIGNELGVKFIVEGSLRTIQNRIKVKVELIQASDGRVIWSYQIDRLLEDIASVQEEIIRLLVVSLTGEVSRATIRSSFAKESSNLQAYDFILRGEHELYHYNSISNSLARNYFERALLLNPTSAKTHSLVARTHIYDWRYRWVEQPLLSLEMALCAARNAIRLDPVDARGLANAAWVLLYRKELDASLRAYEKAHELNPNDADVLALWADAVSYAGDPARALEMVDRAKRLNPHYPDIYLWSEADALFALRRYREVVTCIKQMRDPAEGSRLLAASHAYLGESEQARHYAAIVLRRQPGFRVEDWISIQPEADPSELEHFRQGLYLAGLP